jgi:hypothetical protein
MPYFYDDGTEFDPKQLPGLGLCLQCQKNNI